MPDNHKAEVRGSKALEEIQTSVPRPTKQQDPRFGGTFLLGKGWLGPSTNSKPTQLRALLPPRTAWPCPDVPMIIALHQIWGRAHLPTAKMDTPGLACFFG